MTPPGQPITLTLDESDVREIMTNIQILSNGINELRSNNKVTTQTIGYLCTEVERIRSDIKSMQERGTLHTAAVLPPIELRIVNLENDKEKVRDLIRDMMWRLIAIAAGIGVVSFFAGRFLIV